MYKRSYTDTQEPGFVLVGKDDGKKSKMKKKYVRLEEGVALYSIGRTKFREVAKEANAIRVIGRVVLYDTEKLNEYIDSFEA